ncbi:hypothetical protein [Carboxylicivirga sp. RSCT41]|uniref:hypothetical protein n=1 Tax=Carboxylicivirga agarovorans TaxID=3417570 RepID=UPI003D341AD2
MSKYNAGRVKKYASLIVPMSFCAIGVPNTNCPFKRFWGEKLIDKKVELINQFSVDELNSLKAYHECCIRINTNIGVTNLEQVYKCTIPILIFFNPCL